MTPHTITMSNLTGVPQNINIQNLAGLQGMGVTNIQGLQNLQNLQVGTQLTDYVAIIDGSSLASIGDVFGCEMYSKGPFTLS